MHELSHSEMSLVVAVHEAGHAVACVRRGVPIKGVTLGGSQDAPQGVGPGTLTEPIGVEGCRGMDAGVMERYRFQAIVCLAGRIAEETAFRSGLTKAVGYRSALKDERDAKLFVRSLAMAELRALEFEGADPRGNATLDQLPAISVRLLAECRGEAERLVIENWSAIEAVARKLANSGALTGDEVASLVAAAGCGV